MLSRSNRFALKQSGIIFFSNVTSFFDFLIYLYLAEVIGITFFSGSNDPLVVQLQTFSIFAAGYLARPIGGLLLGRYGDVKGRKTAYLFSSSILVATSLLTACLPTYAQVGMLAPALFIMARLVQGMAFGAHSVLGWVFISEHVPRPKKAFFTNIASVGHMVGVVVTLFIFKFIFGYYSTQEMVNYAWRLPFLASGILGLISLSLGYYLKETPIFLNRQSEQSYLPKYQDVDLSLKSFHAIFISILLSFYVSSLVIVVALILPKLILLQFSVDADQLAFANIIGTLGIALGTLFFGGLADKIGIGKALIIGSAVVSIQAFTFYSYLQDGSGQLLSLMYGLLGFSAGVIGLGPVIMTQLFPTKSRLTSMSVTYNSTYALVGGALPVVLMYATNSLSFAPALYLCFMGIIGIITGLYIYYSPKFEPMDAVH
ncbi:MAG: MFS transporter [Psychrobacter sp.]|nr:MFS transporter [Psychrobacter sp.]